ncbi:MAG: hypothetical protein E6K81_15780, partial [Candidatus Eisenbacteria bacterium]
MLQNGNLPQGLTLATDGAIDGTPTTVGAFGFTVSVTDANGCHGTHNYGITVFTCPLITVLPASMPDGLAGASYQQTLTADGAPPFVFSVSAGSLPPGLALASAGGGQVLYGCDRSGSIFTVDLVTGAGTPTGVHPPLGACTEIESDPAGIAFAQSSDGGFYGARFDLASGALIGCFVSDSGSFQGLEYVGATLYGTYVTGPDGPSTLATLDPVTGAATPIGPTGTGPVSGLAYDAASGTMYGINGGGRFGPGYLLTLDLTTGAATVVGPTGMTAGSLEFGPDGNLYAGGDAINGGRIYRIDRHTGFATQLGPSGFSSVTGLTLGPGFGPGPEATLSGVLRAAGSYTFTVTATDANGCRGDREYHINVACQVISISPATLPPGLVGVPYDQVVTTSGGTGPFTFSSAGFPPGMTVGAPDSGGTSARILGTPSAVGSYACAIHAVDADSCSADREYTLAVTCPPVALGPALLPDGAIGVSYRQVLTPTAGALPVTATLTAGSLPPGLSLSNDAVAAPGRGQGLATRTFPSGTRGPAPRRFTAGQRSIVSAAAPALSAANVLTPAATSSGPRILFALADYDDPDYRAAIAALTGGVVDYFNCAPDLGGSTPSLALLDSYDCVFTKPDFYYADRVLLGDELADYVD